MTPTLGLGSRVALIVWAAVMAVWLSVVSIYYVASLPERDPTLLTPQRIAAIVALMEGSGPREAAMAALTSANMRLRVEPAGPAGAAAAAGGEPDPLTIRLEPIVLGDGRAVSVDGLLAPRRLVSRLIKIPRGYVFRVRLADGDMLEITTRAAVTTTAVGLPIGVVGGLLGTFVALVALIVLHREMAPLRRLAAAADALDLTGASPPLEPPRAAAPEIRSLVAAFNRLQARLATLVAGRMVLVAGISHDVRTFATRLRLRLELLPPGQVRDRAVSDVVDIVAMLDDAIVATRAGAGELAEELVDVGELVAAEVEARRETGARVTLAVPAEAEGISVLGDRLALKRMIANLIDNALKYGNAAHVLVSLPDRVTVAVTVDDEGPGIREADRALLLEPFVRLEGSRNRATGGAGLGLAIVKSLVEAHGGTIAIDDAPTGGARFVLRLPIFSL